MGQTIAILGAGIGGAYVARELASILGPSHRVVLVERERELVFNASLPWLLAGERNRDEITRPARNLASHGIELVEGTVERIDPAQREVKVGGATITADHIVIALGAELVPEQVHGLVEGGHNLYDVHGVEHFRSALDKLERGRLILLTAAPVYKCPAASYEYALLVDHELRRRGVRSAVEVMFYAAEPGPMGVAGPEVSRAVRALIESKGIAYFPEHQVTRVDVGAHRVEFANRLEVGFDLLAYIPPHRAPAVVRDAGLTGDSGWVTADRGTLATRFPGVWAIGDVVALPLKMGKALPKAGVFALGMAKAVVSSIASAVTGQVAPTRFDGHGECFVEVGGGIAARGAGDFFAEPTPNVVLTPPSVEAHLQKLAWERDCLSRWS
jgi:sulfide:quinone oxidoreductase